MFEEPLGKRIRRDELFGRSSSISRSTSPGDILDSQDIQHVEKHQSKSDHERAEVVGYGFEYDLIAPPDRECTTVLKHQGGSPAHEQDTEVSRKAAADIVEEDEGLEFRLFRSKPRNTISDADQESGKDFTKVAPSSDIQKIKIRSPSPIRGFGDGGGGLVNPHRRRDYYFTFEEPAHVQETRRKQFHHIAITGEDVDSLANVKWYGASLPWRILHVSSTSNLSPPSSIRLAKHPSAPQSSKGGRTRPGKKRRLILRRRQASRQGVETAEREKKTRRNREKKVKKRLRDKMKKEADSKAEEAGGGDSSGKQATDEMEI